MNLDESPPASLFVLDKLPDYEEEFARTSTSLRPHERFVFNLGLEIVLSNVKQQLNSSPSNGDDTEGGEGINRPVPDYLRETNFDDDLINLNGVFNNFRLRKCPLCDFKSESRTVIDAHLAEPHFYKRVYKCNFCDEFKTRNREQYRAHLLTEHKRQCKLEKPFESYAFMCPICHYELSTSSVHSCELISGDPHVSESDMDKVKQHIAYQCPFREANLTNPNPKLNVNFRQILNNQLSPNTMDVLNYEFMFHTRCRDTQFVNTYSNIFSASLVNSSSALAVAKMNEESETVKMCHLYAALIREDLTKLKQANLKLPEVKNNQCAEEKNGHEEMPDVYEIPPPAPRPSAPVSKPQAAGFRSYLENTAECTSQRLPMPVLTPMGGPKTIITLTTPSIPSQTTTIKTRPILVPKSLSNQINFPLTGLGTSVPLTIKPPSMNSIYSLHCKLCTQKFTFDLFQNRPVVENHFRVDHNVNVSERLNVCLLKLALLGGSTNPVSNEQLEREPFFNTETFQIKNDRPQTVKLLISSLSKEIHRDMLSSTTSSNGQLDMSTQQQQPTTITVKRHFKINQILSANEPPKMPILAPGYHRPTQETVNRPPHRQIFRPPQMPILTGNDKDLAHVREKSFVARCLGLDVSHLDSEHLLELKLLTGKCYACPVTNAPNLLKHLGESHGIDAFSAFSKLVCICCGCREANVERLVLHLYQKHRIIIFKSLRKIYFVNNNNNNIIINKNNNNNINSNEKIREVISKKDKKQQSTVTTSSSTSINKTNTPQKKNLCDFSETPLEIETNGVTEPIKEQINKSLQNDGQDGVEVQIDPSTPSLSLKIINDRNLIEKKKKLECVKCARSFKSFHKMLQHVKSHIYSNKINESNHESQIIDDDDDEDNSIHEEDTSDDDDDDVVLVEHKTADGQSTSNKRRLKDDHESDNQTLKKVAKQLNSECRLCGEVFTCNQAYQKHLFQSHIKPCTINLHRSDIIQQKSSPQKPPILTNQHRRLPRKSAILTNYQQFF